MYVCVCVSSRWVSPASLLTSVTGWPWSSPIRESQEVEGQDYDQTTDFVYIIYNTEN